MPLFWHIPTCQLTSGDSTAAANARRFFHISMCTLQRQHGPQRINMFSTQPELELLGKVGTTSPTTRSPAVHSPTKIILFRGSEVGWWAAVSAVHKGPKLCKRAVASAKVLPKLMQPTVGTYQAKGPGHPAFKELLHWKSGVLRMRHGWGIAVYLGR